MTGVDTVIFDLDDTLIVEEASARSAIAEALSSVEVSFTSTGVDVVDTAIACARRHWRASPYYDTCRRLGIASWEALWASFDGCHDSLAGLAEWAPVYRRLAWSDTLIAVGADPLKATQVSQTYVDAQRSGHPPIPGAIEAVRQVATRARTGLLTNGPPDIQRLKLSKTELRDAVDAVVISGEVGVGKPDAAAFRHILGLLGSPAEAAIMVGNSWERDVLGSLAIGMRAVWVSHGAPPPEPREEVVVVDEVTYGALEAI